MGRMIQTKTGTSVNTMVVTMVAVAVAVCTGTVIGFGQWQSGNNAVFISELEPIDIATGPDYIELAGSGAADDEAFGGALANAGDLNGDGHDELVVTDVDYPVTDAGTYQQGKIYGYDGGESTISTTPDWSIAASSGYDYADFGQSVSGVGDVNGDGYDDLVVGAPADGEFEGGRAYGYYGSASGIDTTVASWTVDALESDDGTVGQFGYIVEGIGDMNMDGYDDVVIYDGEGEAVDTAVLYLYLGSSTGLATTPAWQYVAKGDLTDLGLQQAFLAGADVNGDDYADLIFGNPYNEDGSVFAFYGSSVGFSIRPDFKILSKLPYTGYAVANAGDVNMDGYDDVIVGAPAAGRGETDEGMVFVYYGSSTGLSPMRKWQVESNTEGAFLGHAVVSAGDVNGDGYSDILVSAPYFTYPDLETTGKAWIYGGSSTGMVRKPLGMAGLFPEDIAAAEEYGNALAVSNTLVGSDGTDIVVAMPSWQDMVMDGTEYYGPMVLVYPNVDL